MKLNLEIPQDIDRFMFDIDKREITVMAIHKLGANSVQMERRIIRDKANSHYVQQVVNEIAEALR